MNEEWTPPDLYTLDWHEAWCKAHAEGRPMPPRTDDPITGYYRGTLFENGPHVPYSYFYADDVLYCEVDNKVYGALEPLPNGQTPREAWQYVVKNPITGKQFMYYIDNGYWEEDAYLHTNNPPPDLHPDSVEIIIDRANKLRMEAELLIRVGAALNQEECDQTDVLINELAELSKHEKDDAWQVAAVDNDPDITPEIKAHHALYRGKGMSLKAAIRLDDVIKSLKKIRLLPFLKKRKADALARGKEPPRSSGKMGVRATALVALPRGTIENRALCLSHFNKAPEIDETLKRLVNAYVRSTKQAPPGCKLVEEEIAS